MWPISSLFILNMLLAIDLIFAGAGWIGLVTTPTWFRAPPMT
ncbi:hypothetical protein V475_00325 [Sphingobium baderi LL03]|uniref:Uncharacterized protein n=1 Tax=Sphingobium baderi LL03 TaxID=1114964 RepID=T0GBT4_9SPHN|nr:hypothetical protein L485_21785 [Sphingobium baderi LL03]KMS63916.1 hypothetical protein V475_00325 [Sphingobium baderi LL03]